MDIMITNPYVKIKCLEDILFWNNYKKFHLKEVKYCSRVLIFYYYKNDKLFFF